MGVYEGLARYLYGALSKDLQRAWDGLAFTPIDRRPSELSILRPLLLAIEPWGNTTPAIWDRLALVWAQQGLAANRGRVPAPLELQDQQDIRAVRPPGTWDELEINLRFKLEYDVARLGRQVFARVYYPAADDVVEGFRAYASSAGDPRLYQVNLRNSHSVIRFARELIETSVAVPLPQRAERVAWALALLSRSWEGYTRAYCELCFRRPHLRLRFCARHTQAAGLKLPGGAHQHGLRLRAFMMQKGTWPDSHAAVVDSLVLAEKRRMEEMFGGPDYEEKAAWPSVVDALERAPLIAKNLGLSGRPNLCPEEGFRLLRERLDPEELDPAAWPWKIEFAEAMEHAAAQLRERKRGRGRKKGDVSAQPERYPTLASELARRVGVPAAAIDRVRMVDALVAAMPPVGTGTETSII